VASVLPKYDATAASGRTRLAPVHSNASVILYLLDERKMDACAVEKLIYQQSGLLGVSGISSDMLTLLSPTKRTRR